MSTTPTRKLTLTIELRELDNEAGGGGLTYFGQLKNALLGAIPREQMSASLKQLLSFDPHIVRNTMGDEVTLTSYSIVSATLDGDEKCEK
jgi:hypothetical protein